MCGAPLGHLSSYALSIMVIYFLSPGLDKQASVRISHRGKWS